MRKLLLTFSIVFLFVAAIAQPPVDARLKGLDTFALKVLKDWHAAGVTIAVVEKGKVVYTGGFGYRDLDKKLPVTENGAKRDSLNELEYIKGYIYANIWLTNNIVKINPADGKVVAKLDLSTLAFKAALTTGGDALNGIAYDSTTDHIYVTGKLWPHIHQLKLSQ